MFLSGQPNQCIQQMGTSFAFHVRCHFCLKWMWIDPQFLDSIACLQRISNLLVKL